MLSALIGKSNTLFVHLLRRTVERIEALDIKRPRKETNQKRKKKSSE